MTASEHFIKHKTLHFHNILLRYEDIKGKGYWMYFLPVYDYKLGAFLVSLGDADRESGLWDMPIATSQPKQVTKEELLKLLDLEGREELEDWEVVSFDEYVQIKEGTPFNPYYPFH